MSVNTWDNLSKPVAGAISGMRQAPKTVRAIPSNGASSIDNLRTRVAAVETGVESIKSEMLRIATILDTLNATFKSFSDDVKQLKESTTLLTTSQTNLAASQLRMEEQVQSQSSRMTEYATKLEKLAEASQTAVVQQSFVLTEDAFLSLRNELAEIRSLVVDELFPDAKSESPR